MTVLTFNIYNAMQSTYIHQRQSCTPHPYSACIVLHIEYNYSFYMVMVPLYIVLMAGQLTAAVTMRYL